MPLRVDSRFFTFDGFLVKDERLRSDDTTGEVLCEALGLFLVVLGLGSALRVDEVMLYPEASRSRLLETAACLEDPICLEILELDNCKYR